MKKTFLLTLTIAISFYSLAQDNPKQKEVGLVFSNFNNFGLTYIGLEMPNLFGD